MSSPAGTMRLIRPIARARARIDRLGGEQQLVGVHPADLARQQHRGVAGRVEPERHLFEREGRVRHGEADLRRQHEIEAAGAGVAVDGADQRCAEVEAGEQRGRHAAQAFEGCLVDALAAREALRRGDRRLHVHAGAEDALAGAGEHGAADLGIGGDAPPGLGERVQRRGIERVGLLRAIDGDQRDVRMGLRKVESDRHDQTEAGSHTLKQLPIPGELSTVTSPP